MTWFIGLLLLLLLSGNVILLFLVIRNRKQEIPGQAAPIPEKKIAEPQNNTSTIQHFKPDQRTVLLAGRLASAAEMIPTAVHDIRQPLSVLCGYLDLLMMHEKKDAEVTDYLQSCSESTIRMETYVSKLRNYARYDKEQTLVNVKVSSRIQRAEELLSEQIQKFHIAITRDYPENEPDLTLSEQDSVLLFHHLLANAIDAVSSVPEPHLKFRIRFDKNNLVFTLQDNGCGITDQDLAACFTPLYTTKTWGTGLGLPYCRAVMANMHGTLEFMRNDNDQPGCCVRLTFPITGGH